MRLPVLGEDRPKELNLTGGEQGEAEPEQHRRATPPRDRSSMHIATPNGSDGTDPTRPPPHRRRGQIRDGSRDQQDEDVTPHLSLPRTWPSGASPTRTSLSMS